MRHTSVLQPQQSSTTCTPLQGAPATAATAAAATATTATAAAAAATAAAAAAARHVQLCLVQCLVPSCPAPQQYSSTAVQQYNTPHLARSCRGLFPVGSIPQLSIAGGSPCYDGFVSRNCKGARPAGHAAQLSHTASQAQRWAGVTGGRSSQVSQGGTPRRAMEVKARARDQGWQQQQQQQQQCPGAAANSNSSSTTRTRSMSAIPPAASATLGRQGRRAICCYVAA
jgi:hypothetical protein